MLQAAKLSLTKMSSSIAAYAMISCILYIAFLLLMKYFGLERLTELRMFNYVLLCVACIIQIKRWVRKTGTYVPFLQVFFTAFFTGVLSFLLFGIFLEIFIQFDYTLKDLFLQNVPTQFQFLPSIVVFFEGTAVSIIVALINLQYFRRYEEHDVVPGKARSRPLKG